MSSYPSQIASLSLLATLAAACADTAVGPAEEAVADAELAVGAPTTDVSWQYLTTGFDQHEGASSQDGSLTVFGRTSSGSIFFTSRTCRTGPGERRYRFTELS